MKENGPLVLALSLDTLPDFLYHYEIFYLTFVLILLSNIVANYRLGKKGVQLISKNRRRIFGKLTENHTVQSSTKTPNRVGSFLRNLISLSFMYLFWTFFPT